MIIPYIVSVIASILFLWILLRKDIPKEIDISLLKDPKTPEASKNNRIHYFDFLVNINKEEKEN